VNNFELKIVITNMSEKIDKIPKSGDNTRQVAECLFLLSDAADGH